MPRAPRICAAPGCANLIKVGEQCPNHPRRQWNKDRQTVNRNRTVGREALRRQHVGSGKKCVLKFACCTGVATELDRIDHRGDYTPGNVQGVCHECHQVKSSREGNAAQGHRTGPLTGSHVDKPLGQNDFHVGSRNEHQPKQQASSTGIPRRIEIIGPPTEPDHDYWPQPW
jgi:hypothetical protein